MKNVQSFFSSLVQPMKPYAPIEPPDQIAKRLGLDEAKIIKLDANENPFGTAQRVLDRLAKSQYTHIYPDPAQTELREAIAAYVGVGAENIVAGAGADELIDLVCRLVLDPGDQVLDCNPTFGYYRHVVGLNRGEIQGVDREPDFSLDLNKLKRLDLSPVKLVFLCSPNNPSGNLIDPEVLAWFLDQPLVVVLDEAYFEFAGETQVSWIHQYPNLLVLRTFSKCFGLAGFRVGYGVMGASLFAGLMKIKPPYSVSVPAQIALLACLEQPDFYQQQVRRWVQIREKSFLQLAGFPQLTPYPSRSNFILCKVEGRSASQLTQALEAEGILVRYFNTPTLQSHLRVSMGTETQMDRFFEVLATLLPLP